MSRNDGDSVLPISERDYLRLLASIVATTDDAVISKTLDGIVTSWNRGAERMYGWTADEMIGNSISRVYPPDKLDELYDILRRVGRNETVDHHETSRVTKDGRRIEVSVSISPMLDHDGKVIGAAKIARDITARVEAERFADAFLADLAHDLNNPLATARIQSQVLRRRMRREQLDPARLEEALTTIEASINRVSRRISELSDISQLRVRGTLRLRLAEMDLLELIHAVTKSVPQRDRIDVRASSERLIGIWDSERLERVFDNLVTNAVKYSKPPTPVIVTVDQDGDRAVVRVIDEGIGIPEGDLPFVFDRFRRGSNVVGQIAGSGIGLAGTRQIIELHGGSIALESVAGSGTTVTVCLPLETPLEQM